MEFKSSVVFSVAVFFLVSGCSAFKSLHPHPDFYGKPCTNETVPEDPHQVKCNLDKNMYCSDKGICECILGQNGHIFTYVHDDRKCIEVSSPINKFACTEDAQCKLSVYGRYSRCNRDYDRCECFDENEKTVLVNDICFIQASPKALRSARGFQGCSEDSDCQASTLGNLSRCNEADKQCECYDTKSSGKKEVAVHNGRCVFIKGLHEFCTEDEECQAGFHKNAVCAEHPSYLRKEMVCQCPEDKRCDDGSGAFSFSRIGAQSFYIVFTTALTGLVATKVIG